MKKRMTRTRRSGFPQLAVLVTATLLAASAHAAKIIKIDPNDPAVLTGAGVETEVKDGQVVKRRQMSQSDDKMFQAGISSMQKYTADIESYPVDEFLYAIDGRAQLTSADGEILEVEPGDALFIPKGWKGRWDTQGFKEIYVIYNSAPASSPANNASASGDKPRKLASKDPRALATPDVKTHDIFKYRVLGKSADGSFRVGMSAMKAHRNMDSESGVDEVLILIEGSETFTSPDGPAVKATAGDVVFMPKAWQGHYNSDGYREIYVIYGPECMATNSC